MEDARLGPNVRPLIDDLVGDIGKSLWVVMATIGIVLLIACANVANLLLVRTEGRAQELAVRAALGAGRGRLAREMLVESLLLGLVGRGRRARPGRRRAEAGAEHDAGPAAAPRADRGRRARRCSSRSSSRLLAGLAFGAIPVLKRGRVRLAEALRAGGRNASAGRDRNITRNTLTIVQVALALVLLIGSGLMIRTFQSMRRVQPGFSDTRHAADAAYRHPRRRRRRRRASCWSCSRTWSTGWRACPGVSSVSLINGLPMTGFSRRIRSSPATTATRPTPSRRCAASSGSAPGAFQVLGTPLAAGREYDWTDLHQKREVVLISENFAREYWGSAAAAIGKRIRSNPNDAWSEVIGVVADIRHDGADRPAPSTVYWPQRATRAR